MLIDPLELESDSSRELRVSRVGGLPQNLSSLDDTLLLGRIFFLRQVIWNPFPARWFFSFSDPKVLGELDIELLLQPSPKHLALTTS